QDPPAEDVDLVVTVDFGSVDRAKFALPARPTLVNIDHHASNDNFGTANLVDVTAAASAELVSRVIDALGIKWTPEMATAALVWTEVRAGDIERAEARDEDISGLVEQVARSGGMRVALLFNEQPGSVKVSCRTSQWEPSVDASAVMARFGGGGHVRAAGALIQGDLAGVRERVLDAARAALDAAKTRAPVSA